MYLVFLHRYFDYCFGYPVVQHFERPVLLLQHRILSHKLELYMGFIDKLLNFEFDIVQSMLFASLKLFSTSLFAV